MKIKNDVYILLNGILLFLFYYTQLKVKNSVGLEPLKTKRPKIVKKCRDFTVVL